MRRLILGAVALAGLAASASTASAQPNRTVIRGSGNGAGNQIIVRNGPAIPLHAPAPVYAGGYAPGGYAPGGYAPGGYAPAPVYGGYAPAPVYPGVNRNVISNSGNGAGNTIITQNGGGYYGSFPGGGVFPGGVNINVVTNSGNGVGNRVITSNGQPGGLNINVITNSGNGAGNTIITRNR